MRATGFLLRGDDIQLHRYVIAGNHSTVIQHLVIVDAPILAVDCEGRGKSDTQPPHVVLNLAVIDKGDSYLVSHAMQAQVSYEYKISASLLHTLAGVRHLWIFCDIQKHWAAEILVSTPIIGSTLVVSTVNATAEFGRLPSSNFIVPENFLKRPRTSL